MILHCGNIRNNIHFTTVSSEIDIKTVNIIMFNTISIEKKCVKY